MNELLPCPFCEGEAKAFIEGGVVIAKCLGLGCY